MDPDKLITEVIFYNEFCCFCIKLYCLTHLNLLSEVISESTYKIHFGAKLTKNCLCFVALAR